MPFGYHCYRLCPFCHHPYGRSTRTRRAAFVEHPLKNQPALRDGGKRCPGSSWPWALGKRVTMRWWDRNTAEAHAHLASREA